MPRTLIVNLSDRVLEKDRPFYEGRTVPVHDNKHGIIGSALLLIKEGNLYAEVSMNRRFGGVFNIIIDRSKPWTI